MARPTELELFIPGIPSNTNRSGHANSGKWQNIRERKHFRELARDIAEKTAMQAVWEPYDFSIISASHISPVDRRRDPLGLAERLKAPMDGLVDAGIIPDDDDKHIQVYLLPSRKGPKAGLYIHIRGEE